MGKSSTGTRTCKVKMTVEAPFPMMMVIVALLLLLLVCCLGLLWRNRGQEDPRYTELKSKPDEVQPTVSTAPKATPAAGTQPAPAAAAAAPAARTAAKKKSWWR